MHAAIQQPEATRAVTDAAQEPPPCLLVRKRGPRRSRRKNVGGQLLAIDGRHCEVRGHFTRHLGETSSRQIDIALGIVRETKCIRGEPPELPDYLRSVSRRQQTHFPAHQACRKSNGKAVTIRADVQNVLSRGKRVGNTCNIRQKVPGRNGRARAVRDDCIGVRMGNQRKRGQVVIWSCARRCNLTSVGESGRCVHSLRYPRAAGFHIALTRRARSPGCRSNRDRGLRHRVAHPE